MNHAAFDKAFTADLHAQKMIEAPIAKRVGTVAFDDIVLVFRAWHSMALVGRI